MPPPVINKKALLKKPKYDPDPPTFEQAWNSLPKPDLHLPLGLKLPVEDDGVIIDPQMPADITELAGDLLGRLYGQFVALAAWLDEQATEAELDAAMGESYLDHVKAETRLAKTGTVADKDAKVMNNQRVLQLEKELFGKQAKAKILRTRVRGYDRCSGALSREMSRRQGFPSV